jgi:hypothetical protein
VSKQQTSSISGRDGVKEIRSCSSRHPANKTVAPAAGCVNALQPLHGAPNAALTHPAIGCARFSNYGGNAAFRDDASSPLQVQLQLPNFHTVLQREQFQTQVHLFTKTFASQDCMFSATQSDARALANAAPTAVFRRSTDNQQFLTVSFSSSEFLCLTKIAVSSLTVPQPI